MVVLYYLAGMREAVVVDEAGPVGVEVASLRTVWL